MESGVLATVAEAYSLSPVSGPKPLAWARNLTKEYVLLQCSSVCSKTFSLGSVYVDLPVFGPKLTAQVVLIA